MAHRKILTFYENTKNSILKCTAVQIMKHLFIKLQLTRKHVT